MPATQADDERDMRATGVALNFQPIDAWAKRNKLTNDSAIADRLDIDRATLSRYRHSKFAPNLAVAAEIARRTGIKLDRLVQRRPPKVAA